MNDSIFFYCYHINLLPINASFNNTKKFLFKSTRARNKGSYSLMILVSGFWGSIPPQFTFNSNTDSNTGNKLSGLSQSPTIIIKSYKNKPFTSFGLNL